MDKLKGKLSRPSNAPIGPVPAFNPDLVPLLTGTKRSRANFYIPTDADYTNMLEHLLVVAYGSAEVIAHAPSENNRFIVSQSLFSLAHVYEPLTDFRHRNWFRELPGSLRYASLLSEVPSHGEFLFREVDKSSKEVKLMSATDVTEHCEKAKEAYKKLQTSTYVLLVSVSSIFRFIFTSCCVLSFRTNQTNLFRSGNGKREGGRGTGRSRSGWTNTTNRKKFYGSKKKSEDDKSTNNRSFPGKKCRGSSGRGRGRGGGQKKKKTTQ